LNSQNGGKSKESTGVCRGIQSQLEHIDQWRPSTRDTAIQNFISKSIDFADSDNENKQTTTTALPPPPSPPGPPNGASPNGGAAAAHALQAVYLSNVLVYPPEYEQDNKNEGDDDDKKKKKKKKLTTTPSVTEEWSCYGSTEVDILVLRPTEDSTDNNRKKDKKDDHHHDDETIAAVAPYCAPGMTVRDIKGGLDQERTKTLRLGILEIVYSTTLAEEDDDNQAEDRMKSNNCHHHQHNHKENNKGQHQEGKKRTSSSDDNDNKDESPNTTNTKSSAEKVYQSGKNVLKHMQLNGKILYDSLQDDFPTRTYEAGGRIYHELYKTCDRTVGMMKKLSDWLSGNPPSPPKDS
jgi:hypothetical protein